MHPKSQPQMFYEFWEGGGSGGRWANLYEKDKRRMFNTDILPLVASPLIKESDMPDRDVIELETFKNLVERH